MVSPLAHREKHDTWPTGHEPPESIRGPETLSDGERQKLELVVQTLAYLTSEIEDRRTTIKRGGRCMRTMRGR